MAWPCIAGYCTDWDMVGDIAEAAAVIALAPLVITLASLAGCATTGHVPVPDADGIYTITAGGENGVGGTYYYASKEEAVAHARKKAANYCADNGQYVNEISLDSYSKTIPIFRKECDFVNTPCRSHSSRKDPMNTIPIGRGQCKVRKCHNVFAHNAEAWAAVLRFKCTAPSN